jgi:hypothetical protein
MTNAISTLLDPAAALAALVAYVSDLWYEDVDGVRILRASGNTLRPLLANTIQTSAYERPGIDVPTKNVTTEQLVSKRQSYVNGVIIHSRGQEMSNACTRCRYNTLHGLPLHFPDCRLDIGKGFAPTANTQKRELIAAIMQTFVRRILRTSLPIGASAILSALGNQLVRQLLSGQFHAIVVAHRTPAPSRISLTTMTMTMTTMMSTMAVMRTTLTSISFLQWRQIS